MAFIPCTGNDFGTSQKISLQKKYGKFPLRDSFQLSLYRRVIDLSQPIPHHCLCGLSTRAQSFSIFMKTAPDGGKDDYDDSIC